MHRNNLSPNFLRPLMQFMILNQLHGKVLSTLTSSVFHAKLIKQLCTNLIAYIYYHLSLEPKYKTDYHLQTGLYNESNGGAHYKECCSHTVTNVLRRSCRICTVLLIIGAICLQAQLMKLYL